MKNSYSQILRSSSVIGGASIFTILISIIRTKILAVMLGAGGIGLISLLTVIMETMTTVSGLGINTSGVRQVAGSNGNDSAQNNIRRALFLLNLILGLTGGAALYFFSNNISTFVFGDATHAVQISWLSLGVFLSALAGSQSAIIQGMRQVGTLARISIISSLLSTCVGISAVWVYGDTAIPFFIVLGPLFNFIVSSYFTSSLPVTATDKNRINALTPQIKALLSLGLVLMLTALMANLTQLVIRSLLTQDLGLQATGYFQAAWSITMQYIGFVLAAMATDYFPRLTNVIQDKDRVNKIVNEQVETGLLLAGPVMLAVLVLAPYIIGFLYSSEFSDASTILRWQAAGDILKVAAWPMGFILIAKEERRMFFFTQSAWHLSYIFLVWIGMKYFGLTITGIAFFACYLLGFILNTVISRHVIQFRFSAFNARLLATLLIMSISMLALSYFNEILTIIIGLPMALALGIYGLRRLIRHTIPGGRLGHFLHKFLGLKSR